MRHAAQLIAAMSVVPSQLMAECYHFDGAFEVCSTYEMPVQPSMFAIPFLSTEVDERRFEVFWTGEMPADALGGDLETAFYAILGQLQDRLEDRFTVDYVYDDQMGDDANPVRFVRFNLEERSTANRFQFTMYVTRRDQSFLMIEAVRTRSSAGFDAFDRAAVDAFDHYTVRGEDDVIRLQAGPLWEAIN